MADFVTRPLTPQTWPDLETLFGLPGGSIVRGCWCMFYRRTGAGPPLPAGQTAGQANKQELCDLMTGGTSPGLDPIYYGSQFLHRTHDGGVTWQTLSPDLTAHPEGTQGASGEPITRAATGEEIYSTVYAIRESPLQKGLIWTGSNDGLIFVTRDDGKTWTNVTPSGLPPGGRVQNRQRAARLERGRAGASLLRLGEP